jgi:DNA ligase-1
MKAFSELLDLLSYTPSRNGKLRLMAEYFTTAPDPDRGYALAALTDGLFFRLPVRRILGQLLEGRVDPALYALSRDYVGDTAETVALLWSTSDADAEPPRLGEIVDSMRGAAPAKAPLLIASWLDRLDASGRWALLKLLTGAPRVGVSARLAKTALAQGFDRDVGEIEELWHGLVPPYGDLFAWLMGGARPECAAGPVFRPLMLSHPIEDRELGSLDFSEFAAEWKWDGIRVQISARGGETRLYSRTGDDISKSFPDVARGLSGDISLDGELLVARGGVIAPFNDLQQRLNRKAVTPKLIAAHPAHVRLYDLLWLEGEDMRALPYVERRARLIAWHEASGPAHTDVSEAISFESRDSLEALWARARETGIEGLMLKRKASPYIAGRPRGHWFKWKRSPLTIDAVLMYAQRGSGKRSSYYSDYTFGCWRAGDEGDELAPVGKAYSGFTDEELLRIDRWVRAHTTNRFGPVREVEPLLVFEVAFDAVHPSTRHKSGVAMRFPRIHRIRWDKPAAEADRLETLAAMIAD